MILKLTVSGMMQIQQSSLLVINFLRIKKKSLFHCTEISTTTHTFVKRYSLFPFRFLPGSTLCFFKVADHSCNDGIVHYTKIIGYEKNLYAQILSFEKKSTQCKCVEKNLSEQQYNIN